MRKVFWNGLWIDEIDARYHYSDAALMQGYIFEMTRSFDHKHFLLEDHLDRLFNSAKYINLNIPYNKNEILFLCESIKERNEKEFKPTDEHRLIINVSHGVLGIYEQIEGIEKGPNFMISDIPLRWTVRGMGKLFDEGLNLVITNQKAIPSRILDNRIKHHNRLHSLMANIEVSGYKGTNNWALLTDENGFITECPGANVLIVKDDVVISPKSKEILNGISRKYIKENCEFLGIRFIEDDLLYYDVINADECFVCATPFCMLPVTSLNGIKIGEGKRGIKFNKLLNFWSEVNYVDIEEQIKTWNKEDGESIGNTPYQFRKN